MAVNREKIKRTLSAGRETALAAFSAIQDDEWEQQSGNPDWLVIDNLAHLAVNNNELCNMVERSVRGEAPFDPTLDLDRWNASQIRKQRGRSVPDLLAQFEQAHERAAALVDQFSDEQLELHTSHPLYLDISVGNLLRVVGLHDQIHAPDIRVVRTEQTV